MDPALQVRLVAFRNNIEDGGQWECRELDWRCRLRLESTSIELGVSVCPGDDGVRLVCAGLFPVRRRRCFVHGFGLRATFRVVTDT